MDDAHARVRRHPPEALMITRGKPTAARFQNTRSSSAGGAVQNLETVWHRTTLDHGGQLADTLSPIKRMTSALGRMKVKLKRSICSAKVAFSARKP